MILLDTNVLSAVASPKAERRIAEWLDKQPRTSIWTSSITVFELRYGLAIMPLGKRRTLVSELMEELLATKIGGRIAVFDENAARHAGDLMALRQKAGRPVELRDTMIAGIALATNATLVTRNVSDFSDLKVPVINPWIVV
jgi:toxin FitB